MKTEKVWEEKFLKIASFKHLFYMLKDQSESESHTIVSDSATPWIIQSMEFSRPEYCSGQLIPSPTDLPNPGIEPESPALQADSLPTELSGKPKRSKYYCIFSS